ncbi:MAG TPA: SMEK domain-containing protein [Fimbriimonadaceae bacterium]|nr:SMEK domain-containing protein [Fimbriimonadaceae bacterium]
MNLERVQERIRHYFSVLVAEVQAAGATGRTDVNVAAESALLPVFRRVWGLDDLRNLNTSERQNFPGIDLADDAARVAFQVTATANSEKVKETLRKFVRYKLYERYDRLIIYILTQKQGAYSGTGYAEILNATFTFDAERDIYDFRDVLRLIADFPAEQAREIESILEANIGPSNKHSTIGDLPANRKALIAHTIAAHTHFRVPSLGMELPIEQAWVRLRVLQGDQPSNNARTLAAQIHNYVEWHRLADSERPSEVLDVEAAAQADRLLVVVGGPGAGKSTLTRRLAWAWAGDGHVVFRVSLREVATRLRKGESFTEALLACARGGVPASVDLRVFEAASLLLADGLDESDPDCSILADHLRRWSAADPKRRVVVTTRPVGYDPAWFSGWRHVELLPLGTDDIQCFARSLYENFLADEPERARELADDFLAALSRSRTASIAARNPQLLGVLTALHVGGSDIGGPRYQLFGKAVEQIRRQQPRDRVLLHQAEPAEAHRVLECLGWELLRDLTLGRDAIIERVGSRLAADLGVPPLAGIQKAELALAFWEERGLLERLRVAGEDALVFVHLLFRDYAAATYLSRLPDNQLAEWVRDDGGRWENREALLLIGGTSQVAVVINTLLQDDTPEDPISTEALLAADMLGEVTKPPSELRMRVIEHLAPRLTSPVPMVAYQAGGKLLPLARVNPKLIGPIARDLAKHDHQWTRENACGLGVVAGDDYVEAESLAEILPQVSNTGDRSGQSFEPSDDSRRSIWYQEPLLRELIIRSAEYLLRGTPKPEHLAAVREKFSRGNHSRDVHEELARLLGRWLTEDELNASRPSWDQQNPMDVTSWFRRLADSRVESVGVLRAIVRACNHLGVDRVSREPDPYIGTVEIIWKVTGLGKDTVGALRTLGTPSAQSIVAEVLRGAIIVAGVDPEQLRADAEHALDELSQQEYSANSFLSATAWKSSVFHFFAGWPESWQKVEHNTGLELLLHWDRGRELALDPSLLVRAMAFPLWSICRTAALLLLNCIDRTVARTAFQRMANEGTSHQLQVVAAIADVLWGNQTATVLLDRLETNLTAECAPLIKTLGRVTHDDATLLRTLRLLPVALAQPQVRLVEAAIAATEALDLSDALEEHIRSTYRWWLTAGPRGPDSWGTVPPNAAEALLRHLNNRERLTYDEMRWAIRQASELHRSEVKQLLLPLIANHLGEHPAAVGPAMTDIECGALPADVISELSRSRPEVLAGTFETVARLLAAETPGLRLAVVRALGDGWVCYRTVERLLRPLFAESDLSVRDEALASLRRLRARQLT